MCTERQNWSYEGSDEQPDISSLPAEAMVISGPCHHIWHGPAAAGSCVAVHGPCYYQKPYGDSWSGLPPRAMLMSQDFAELAPLFSGGSFQKSWQCPSKGQCWRAVGPDGLSAGKESCSRYLAWVLELVLVMWI